VRVEASASGHDDRAVALALASHEAMTTVLVKPWVEFIYAEPREERGWRQVN